MSSSISISQPFIKKLCEIGYIVIDKGNGGIQQKPYKKRKRLKQHI